MLKWKQFWNTPALIYIPDYSNPYIAELAAYGFFFALVLAGKVFGGRTCCKSGLLSLIRVVTSRMKTRSY